LLTLIKVTYVFALTVADRLGASSKACSPTKSPSPSLAKAVIQLSKKLPELKSRLEAAELIRAEERKAIFSNRIK
jgi:hypothetical protein